MMAFTETGTGRRRLRGWSAVRWAEHYRANARAGVAIPWEQGARLSDQERSLLLPSLRELQQGEGLEGGAFFRRVREYADRTGDADYAEAHALFMAEEQRHAALLARFLNLAGVPLLTKRSLLSRLFCWLGGRGGLESTLAVVLAVEVVGQLFYRAVRSATASPVLRGVCAQLLRDEQAHVRFQCEMLARLRHGRPAWALRLRRLSDRLLCVGAGLACWLGHGHVLRAGGFGWRRFWRAARRLVARSEPLADPRNYDTPSPSERTP